MNKTNQIKVLGMAQFASAGSAFYTNTIYDHLRTSHTHINRPHKHDFYVTVLFTKGIGEHVIDFNHYVVKPGSVFFLAPGQTHHWNLSDDADGIIFFHSHEFYETHYIDDSITDYRFFSYLHPITELALDATSVAEILPLFEKLMEVSMGEKLKKRQLQLSIITQIYITLEDLVATSTTAAEHTGYYSKFVTFGRLLEQHFRTKKSANAYSAMMFMTPKHLNRINRAVIGKTTTGLITDRVILEAKRMLIYARNNLVEVADALGYADYAHFSKLFKAKTGLSPGEFAKINR